MVPPASADFDYDTDVTLTALSSPDSTFTGWSEAECPGTGSCTVAMISAKSVTANFILTLDSYTLTIINDGTGIGSITSDPSGINCGNTCSIPFDRNTDVTLTAGPGLESTFEGWSGSGCSGNWYLHCNNDQRSDRHGDLHTQSIYTNSGQGMVMESAR